MIERFTLGEDQVYRCAAWLNFGWLHHGFGTRLGSPAAAITLKQIHSATVWNARGVSDRECEGDALITCDGGKIVGVRTADCVPILLLDPRHKAVAAVHAGWRGTASGILQRAVTQMAQDFGTDSKDVQASIGPCIRACCYEVGAEVAARFEPFFPEWRHPAGRRSVDLAEANRRQLLAAGVPSETIFDCGLCTFCLPEQFFSFRREPENPGRMLSAIGRPTSNLYFR